jgi:hypothetical protein
VATVLVLSCGRWKPFPSVFVVLIGFTPPGMVRLFFD